MRARLFPLLCLPFAWALSASAPVNGSAPDPNPDLDFLRSNAQNVHRSTPKALAIQEGKRLRYTPDEDGNRLPDFSFAGYMGGGVPIPTVAIRQTVEADAADPSRDRSADIQKALDALAALPMGPDGFRGALLLGKGKFTLRETLRIPASGVVVRGSGAGFGGTWIYHRPVVQKSTEMQYLGGISVEGGMVPTFLLTAKGAVERRALTEVPADASLACGERVIPVVDASGIRPGMEILLEVVYTDKWLEAIKRPMDWGTRTVVPRLRRRVASVDPAAKTVTLERPLSLAIDRKAGLVGRCRVHQILADTRPYHIGIEDILFLSGYDAGETDKAGYFNDENHPFTIFYCEGATDVWMRRCTGFFYSMSLMTPNGSSRVTVEDCAMLDGVSRDTPATHTGARKYYFNITADDMLVQRCYGRYARHAFVGNGTWEGGVFRDCYSERDHLNIEWHQLWGYGHLYDQVACHAPIAMRGCTNAPHGQCAAFSLAWNCAIRNDQLGWADLWLNRVPGVFNNWAAGCLLLGSGRSARAEDAGGGHHHGELGHVEYGGAFMPIRSLSLSQLGERSGPEAVRAVSTTAQREGPHGAVWTDLIERYSKLPIWMDPESAPWPGWERWVAVPPANGATAAVSAPSFVRERLASASLGISTAEVDPAARYLSDLTEESFSVHRDTLHRNKRYADNQSASIVGVAYPKSLLLHPKGDTRRGEVVFSLSDLKGKSFRALVGIEDQTAGRGSVSFEVQLWKDGGWESAFKSPVVGGGDAPLPVEVGLAGATKIKLVCLDGGDGVGSDHGVWALPSVK